MDMDMGNWLALIAIIVALVIGIIQIIKSKSGNNVNINQTSGCFSKTKQKINWKDSKDE